MRWLAVGAALGLPGRTLATRLALVVLGGGAGSAARYMTALWAADRLGVTIPWGTLAVNVTGSFVIGLLATLADEAGAIGPDARTFLVVGVLGGFTTFSSFSLESLRLVEQNELLRAGLYVAGSVGLAFAAAALGIGLARTLSR